ncbi:2-oxoacid:acceptor oxidoreductase family protein [Paenibacillus sp. URB8-2]|uniref:2-oxoacid:acceptor oxidoreductase family protein n=1 Tax=Paenibacillus sp. URB8-2 TaxID=2741301 RepID=UPI0015BA7465|nr:2-oxoacid:acceptor oxidoreductase family protein [Paenibacillus sp. URB8-2]BCG59112.1 pyruvate ferredoxin oxidoreductase subunit gamma [Paenibacillus sp. URB8-2]
MIEIRWHGRGGQGSFTASKLLGSAVTLYGSKHALAFPSFGPERRGAPMQAFTKIDDVRIRDRSEITRCDYIVVLDETLYRQELLSDLKEDGKLILNASRPEKYQEQGGSRIIALDATSVALEILNRPITNTAMLGALIGVSGITGVESVLEGMSHFLKGSLLDKNRQVVSRIYDEARRLQDEPTRIAQIR